MYADLCGRACGGVSRRDWIRNLSDPRGGYLEKFFSPLRLVATTFSSLVRSRHAAGHRDT